MRRSGRTQSVRSGVSRADVVQVVDSTSRWAPQAASRNRPSVPGPWQKGSLLRIFAKASSLTGF